MAELALVIPAWLCTDQVLEAARVALPAYQDAGADIRIIVVDNGSDRGSDLLEEHADTYIRFDENQGYAGGVNAGLREVTDEPTVCIASIDLEPPVGWAVPMLEAQPALVSVVPHPSDGGELKRDRRRGPWWGAMFAFPSDLLGTVGLMNDTEFAAFADRDYGVRLAATGIPTHRVPVGVKHLAPNHAFRHQKQLDRRGTSDKFSAEVMLFRRRYGAMEFGDWWRKQGRTV